MISNSYSLDSHCWLKFRKSNYSPQCCAVQDSEKQITTSLVSAHPHQIIHQMPSWPFKGVDNVQLLEFDFHHHVQKFLPNTPTRFHVYPTFHILLTIGLHSESLKRFETMSNNYWQPLKGPEYLLSASFQSILETKAHFPSVFVEHQESLEQLQEYHTHWEPLSKANPSVLPSEHCEILKW